MIAATKPTIPASPKPWTRLTMLSATPPTNGTFPPSRATTIPSPNKAITTLVKLLIVPVRPDNIFMFNSLFLLITTESQSVVLMFFYHTKYG